MLNLIKAWYRRYFTDPQAAIVALLLIAALVVVVAMGDILAPIIAALVIAYLLDGVLDLLRKARVPHLLGVNLVFVGFIGVLVLLVIVVAPLMARQITAISKDLPTILMRSQELLLQLPDRYPDLITQEQMESIVGSFRSEIADGAQRLVTASLASVFGLIPLLVYLVLVPFMVFFLLKDKQVILNWVRRHLPRQRELSSQIWRAVNKKMGRFVRGKVIEILIVWLASYLMFIAFSLNYALLLSALVGLSVIIPYLGAAAVTLPVALVGFVQWGADTQLVYLLIAYGVLQFLDGNVLVPILFSEVVNLHPIAIIVAVVIFGGFWGMWGVFFAIPLATLIQVLIDAWPRRPVEVMPPQPSLPPPAEIPPEA